jgi:DNA (cytosine-5)-methyltransferase 1
VSHPTDRSTGLKYASVCDGIGAAHVAWQPLGWQCQWTSEIEPFPVAVVEHHYGFRNLGDMTAITEEMLDAPVDLLVGGTPCQSFSVAGLRGGLADPRGNLALRFVQLAAVMQPKWIVWENVPGVLSSNKGRDFGTFLGALAELGYGFAYRVLDAQWFGVAQRRRRVFVVGYLGDWRRAAAVLFERESVFGNPPTRGATGQGITSSPQGIAGNVSSKWAKGTGGPAGDECYNLVAAYGFKQGANHSGACGGLTEDCEPPLTCGQDHNLIAFRPTQDPISSLDGSTHAMGCGLSGGCCTQAVAFTAKDSGGDATQDVAPTMRAMGHSGSHANGGGQLAVAFTKSKRAQSTTDETWVPGEVSPAMSCFDQGDTRATTVVAFANRTRDGIKVPELMKDGLVPALTNPGKGGRSDAVNVAVALQDCSGREKRQNGKGWNQDGTAYTVDAAATQGVAMAFKPGQSEASTTTVAFVKATNPHSSEEVPRWEEAAVAACLNGWDERHNPPKHVVAQQAMAVRRLTPRECERLQGFPDDYTLVEYRKKPAADGPRYRALGNSMAVPVMRWIGERIAMVDRM